MVGLAGANGADHSAITDSQISAKSHRPIPLASDIAHPRRAANFLVKTNTAGIASWLGGLTTLTLRPLTPVTVDGQQQILRTGRRTRAERESWAGRSCGGCALCRHGRVAAG